MANEQSSGKGDKKKTSLREENELLKLKLKAEHGAEFSESGPGMPDEVEHEFLQNVDAFEKAWAGAGTIKVYDKIGKPDYKLAADLSDAQISSELKRINNLLEQHNIGLDVQGTYDDRTIYKFITEELFDHKMDDMDVPGMGQFFIYEEFHPNPVLDAREALYEFLNGLDKEPDFDPELNVDFALDRSLWRFHEQGITDNNGQHIDSKAVKKRYEVLRDSVAAIAIEKIDEGSAEIKNENEAIYTTMVQYRYNLQNEANSVKVDGPLTLYLRPSEHAAMWAVTKMEGPGLVL